MQPERSSGSKERGFGLLEVVIAVGIVSLTVFSLGRVNDLALRVTSQAANRAAAALVLEEGVEALRFLRDGSWSANLAALTPGATYYLSFATTTYVIETAPPAPIGGLFERSFRVEKVWRDGQDTIAAAGTEDPATRRLVVEVAWTDSAPRREAVVFYLTDLYGN